MSAVSLNDKGDEHLKFSSSPTLCPKPVNIYSLTNNYLTCEDVMTWDPFVLISILAFYTYTYAYMCIFK